MSAFAFPHRGVCLLFWLLALAGCGRTERPAELEYSNADVQTIREEIDRIEWD